MTYATYGMTEWLALLPVGRALVRIPFTGGSVTGFGVRPATFSTNSPGVAKLIENSTYFASGKIVRIK